MEEKEVIENAITNVTNSIIQAEAMVAASGLPGNRRLEIINHLMQLEETVKNYAFETPSSGVELKLLRDTQQISMRTANIFLRSGCETLQDVAGLTEREVKRLRNCGMHSIIEMKKVLEENGLKFKDEEHEEE